MRIEQLRYFIEVAKTSSINIAANNLYLTQPSISEALKKLEAELDIALLERSHTGVSLTEAGKLILPMAEDIIHQSEALQEQVQRLKAAQMTQPMVNDLKVGVVSALAKMLIPQLTRQLSQRYPEITLQIMTQSVARIKRDLLDKRLDMGVVVIFPSEIEQRRTEGLQFIELSKERAYALVAFNHSLAGKKW